MPDLPLVDEHAVDVGAEPDVVWAALTSHLGAGLTGAVPSFYARLVGCEDTAATGPRPLAEGSAVPGFHVVAAEAPSLLALVGRHRFSTYALTFRVDALDDGRSRLRAETRARFPGLGGRLYRLAVIGSRGHVVAVRRMLAAVRARSLAACPTTPTRR